MVRCFAPGCNHSRHKDICRFFNFPKNQQERDQWIKLLRQKDKDPSKQYLVCSCHFKNEDRKNGPTLFFSNMDIDKLPKSLSPVSQISCEVDGCTSKSSDSSREFFHFPKIKSLSDKWVKFCNKQIPAQDLTQLYICCLHFEDTAFIHEIQEKDEKTHLIRILNINAVPTLLPSKPISDTEKYSYIKTQTDLLKLKITNKILEKKLKKLEQSSSSLKKYLEDKTKDVELLESETSNTGLAAENILTKIFSPSQIKLLLGNKKTVWSKDDLAIGCTVRYLSSQRFYTYLTNQLNFPLPGDSSIRRYASGRKKIREEEFKTES